MIVSVYGGPHAQTVTNAWEHVSPRDSLLASRGFLVFKLDNRGMAARGTAFEFPLHRDMGRVELQDQLVGVEHLKSLPFVDPGRIGITGWSYGGYLTLYALTNAPSVFKAGVAGAPVTDWKHYDSIYTERYMGTPENNPKGYETSSPLQKAAALEADLLLIHGASDDNVHLANTMAFVAALVKAGKPYSLQVHPRQLHGFRPKEDRIARDRALLAHFERTLRPGSDPGAKAADAARAPLPSARPQRRRAAPAITFSLRPKAASKRSARPRTFQDGSVPHGHRPPARPSSGTRAPLALPGGVRSVISSASASSTAARSSGSSSSCGHERRERAAQPLVLVAGLAHHGREQRHLPVREAGEVGREHQVGHVLVAVEEVDGPADVQDPRPLPQRVRHLDRGPALERRVERAGERLAPRRAVLGPAHEARRERVERPPPHALRRVERLARHAEREPLAHALAGHHDRVGPEHLHQRLDHDRAAHHRVAPVRVQPRHPRASSGARPRARALISCSRRRASS